MRLPGGTRAVVPRAKLEDYLLSESHPEGRFKARFFRSTGFSNANELATSLLEIARTGEVTAWMSTEHGQRYVVDGTVETPTGTLVELRTVWIREVSSNAPRLVTAYPQ